MASFRQVTSRLYERDDGKRTWRGEHPACAEAKAAAEDTFNTVKTASRLDELELYKNQTQLIASLRAAKVRAGPGVRTWHK